MKIEQDRMGKTKANKQTKYIKNYDYTLNLTLKQRIFLQISEVEFK